MLSLYQVPGVYTICRLAPDDPIPDWAAPGEFWSFTRAPQELSIVCEARVVPEGVRREDEWGILSVRGPLDFSLCGVLSQLTAPLARAGIPVFVLSTFDTDHILIRTADLDREVETLRSAGYAVETVVRQGNTEGASRPASFTTRGKAGPQPAWAPGDPGDTAG